MNEVVVGGKRCVEVWVAEMGADSGRYVLICEGDQLPGDLSLLLGEDYNPFGIGPGTQIGNGPAGPPTPAEAEAARQARCSNNKNAYAQNKCDSKASEAPTTDNAVNLNQTNNEFGLADARNFRPIIRDFHTALFNSDAAWGNWASTRNAMLGLCDSLSTGAGLPIVGGLFAAPCKVDVNKYFGQNFLTNGVDTAGFESSRAAGDAANYKDVQTCKALTVQIAADNCA